jgi:hypothetical protein
MRRSLIELLRKISPHPNLLPNKEEGIIDSVLVD